MVTRQRKIFRWRLYAWCILGLLILYGDDYRPNDVDRATAPYQFSVVSWELANLPDKWVRQAIGVLPGSSTDSEGSRRREEAELYFEAGRQLAETERRLIRLEAERPALPKTAREIAQLRQIRTSLAHSLAELRGDVEETLESAVADTLQELGFGGRPGVFPPVDTVLTGSPTVLVLSPRERIERLDGTVLKAELAGDEREQIESKVETSTDWSALVVNTGGIAFYPSIARSDVGLDFALETIAHEWVHHWLWFRPLGRRYFESGELATLNETVATIAGIEIGQLARHRLEGTEPQPPAHPYHGPTAEEHTAPSKPARFDLQAEMRATRVRVDELLAAGDVAGAEAYMEERRLIFVSEGYAIRKLNQAYFAFHGTYATTGAAGVNIIGEQMKELRRRSSSLEEFLRATAQITSAEDLTALLESGER
ncbi:MAG: hypothetical protein F4W95_02445 [Chloroflexi bacterium]|nr:hypothetical protein [Chloroflexota bacterium]MYD47325.1 hypothetical protein [Chloroflexota bacterium]